MARKKRKPLITSSAHVTARDPKGIQTISVVEAGYNELQLEDDAAQRINERGDEVKAGVMALFKKLSAPPPPPPPPAPPLLQRVVTTMVPATTEPFRAKDHFVQNTGKDVVVKIAYLGENFRSLFLGKEEPAMPGGEYAVDKLNRNSLDTPIIKELGGEAKAEISLAAFCGMLRAQGNRQEDPLRTDGWWNIAYIRAPNDTLYAVYADWGSVDGGWRVSASSVASPREWRAGDRILSRVAAA